VFFIWIHSLVYGGGDLSNDGASFMLEGKYLNQVFQESWMDYLKLLTGWGANDALIHKYLYMTEYWSTGNLTIINDSKNIVRIHSIIHFFSSGNTSVHLAVFCLVSLFASVHIYKAIEGYTDLPKALVFWTLALFPSVIFWTSNMLKEPFMFLGLSLALRAILEHTTPLKRVLFGLIGFILLLSFKPYILICLFIASALMLMHFYVFNEKWVATGGVLITVILSFTLIPSKPSKWTIHHLSRKQFDFINVGKGGLHVLSDTCFYYFQPHQYKNLTFNETHVELIKPTRAYIVQFGSTKQPVSILLKPKSEKWRISYFKSGCSSYIPVTPLNDSWSQLALNIPEALLNSVLRPFPNDNGSFLKHFGFIENIVFLLVAIFTLFHKRSPNLAQRKALLLMIGFSLLLFLLVGWITPVLGAIVRYRFPAQLALLLCCLTLVDPQKIKWKRKNMH
jgi:hypothetical protein